MDIIRLVIQVIFISFFYWFIFSVIRVIERDLVKSKSKFTFKPDKIPTRGGD
ncbi:MAG TPA: hypothetical protein VJ036_04515 [bacterium]|nr:hypothetical protein [bacterium]